MASPIRIIGQHLVDTYHAHWADTPHPSKLPDATADMDKAWPLWLSTLPYGPNDPDDTIALFGPDGRLQGRLMATGEMVRYPGLQVRTRAKDYDDAFDKIEALFTHLTTGVRRTVVTVNEVEYMIHAVTARTDIIEMGIDDDTDLQNFSANFLVRISLNT